MDIREIVKAVAGSVAFLGILFYTYYLLTSEDRHEQRMHKLQIELEKVRNENKKTD